ncbi:hypothetical protein N7492_006600 [Penicillium capsulatum]|uniref:Uncharacterized protein n=1 Tax=Penicillium capsulatum TaxID=69766 RepID=A0A9W9LL14_9EURO|nr:hypothetical protein N7492_006600 [Penicillium capsulatum]KAJ6116435.1 hypothetical protein N7512_006160 [Penicillium capsulatum]
MWKSKMYLDRDYASISQSNNDLRYEVYGAEQPLTGSLTSFPDLEDPEEVNPKHVSLLVFCIACFIFAGTFLVLFIAVQMTHKPLEA